MKEHVYLSETGDDKDDGLHVGKPVRTAAHAVKIANKTGRNIQVVGNWDAVARLSAELKLERKKTKS